jgi:hypothetical protein
VSIKGLVVDLAQAAAALTAHDTPDQRSDRGRRIRIGIVEPPEGDEERCVVLAAPVGDKALAVAADRRDVVELTRLAGARGVVAAVPGRTPSWRAFRASRSNACSRVSTGERVVFMVPSWGLAGSLQRVSGG